ncbi:DUF4421 domain-containing protein [Duncaniella muricolitica]|uniref:DUF4421 domain-containing protein n=1 Tax=Duncaniella muricolitica TaxID=2880704 RepID=UPI00244E051F|nr:DUF4421 domain-containing protein [Duncaniella muricolitica]
MRHLITIFAMLLSLTAMAVEPTSMTAGEPDSTACDTCCEGVSKTYWIKQLIDNGFRIHDERVCYPRFPRFCLNVYNWGDRTFNSYDTAYVVGTGKNWKLQGKSYNWMETSTITIPKQSSVNMHSDLYSDAGFSLNFMAVSIGYMWNINKLFTDPTNRRTFNFDFTCSRFSLNYQSVSSTGGMIITQFGDYNNGHRLHYKFDDCSTDSKTLDVYWFFNHYRYSQAAAYSYSKYQLRNAGTPLVGFNFTEQHIKMNFNGMPAIMLEHSPLESNEYQSDYRSYCAMGGYSYNWVLKPRRWLINATGMVAVGYRQLISSGDERDSKSRVANNFKINVAAVYNHKALFAAFTARGMGYVNYNMGDLSHLNTIISFTAAVGMRF